MIKHIVDLPRMADEAQDILHQALDAFVRHDVDLDRAAEWVTNICERVVFTVTGELQEMDANNASIKSAG